MCLELRYIWKLRIDPKIAPIKNKSYTKLTTFKAVAESLRSQGHDTTEIDVLLFRAENAHGMRKYDECLGLINRIKIILAMNPE
ncbi:MAG: hypothetical protein GX369_02765 [Euryarchaeota archaeon]|nr:hypothetical protein [Euryarchaeota archaeon]